MRTRKEIERFGEPISGIIHAVTAALDERFKVDPDSRNTAHVATALAILLGATEANLKTWGWSDEEIEKLIQAARQMSRKVALKDLMK